MRSARNHAHPRSQNRSPLTSRASAATLGGRPSQPTTCCCWRGATRTCTTSSRSSWMSARRRASRRASSGREPIRVCLGGKTRPVNGSNESHVERMNVHEIQSRYMKTTREQCPSLLCPSPEICRPSRRRVKQFGGTEKLTQEEVKRGRKDKRKATPSPCPSPCPSYRASTASPSLRGRNSIPAGFRGRATPTTAPPPRPPCARPPA